MSNLEVYEYNKQPIEFNTGESDVMINATHMGKAFGKKPKDFLKADQTKDFISALSKGLKGTILPFKIVVTSK